MHNGVTTRDGAPTPCAGAAVGDDAPSGSTEPTALPRPTPPPMGKTKWTANPKAPSKVSPKEKPEDTDSSAVKAKLKAATKEALRIKALLKSERAKAPDLASRI